MKIRGTNRTVSKITAILFILSAFLLPGIPAARASAIDGTIDATNKYAWSDKGGWINFGDTPIPNEVHVTDTAVTGYAWIANFGWINLAVPSAPVGTAGVKNDGNGTLSGYAWGEQTGYINFSGVTIDSSGVFHGYASNPILGTISFNCLNTSSCGTSNFKVSTDWRPVSARTPVPPSTGGSGAILVSGTLIINGGSSQTTNQTVTVSGTGYNANQVIISENNNFDGASYQLISSLTTFTLSSGYGTKTIYYKFNSGTGESPIYSQTIDFISPNAPVTPPVLQYFTAGSVVKGSATTVYYISADGMRYVFPNPGTYFSWYPSYSIIQVVSDDLLSQLAIGGNVTYKPGSLVKLTTDPKVYIVSDGGVLHWIPDEATAIQMYGANWASLIHDLPDAFFTNYTIGSDVSSVTDLQNFGVSNNNPDGSLAGTPATAAGVIVYEHILYQGKSMTSTVDIPDLRKSGIGNDVVSSLKIVSNAVVQLFQHIFYQGREETFAVSDSDLRNNFIGNDVASSIKITDKTALKEKCGIAFTFTKYLAQGSSGAEVLKLQQVLQCLGYFPADIVPNGYFGLATKASVLKFQIAHGIPAAGYVGVQTRLNLNSYMK